MAFISTKPGVRVGLFPGGQPPELRNRSGWHFEQKKEPRRNLRLWRGLWTGRISRIRILASSPRACLNRQAGFTAARPAANWIPWSAAGGRRRAGNLEGRGRFFVAPRVEEDIWRGADLGRAEWG